MAVVAGAADDFILDLRLSRAPIQSISDELSLTRIPTADVKLASLWFGDQPGNCPA